MKNKINLYRSTSQRMNDAVDRIVVEVYQKKREKGYKSVLLTGCSSKSGTTTNAINLAIALSVAGWNTLLVDCDLRKGSDQKRLNDDADKGLTNYLNGSISEEETIYETSYEGLSYIPCGTASDSPVRLLCSVKMEALVANLEAKYDFVIFDFPSIDIVPDAEILIPFADAIALVAAMNQTTKRQLVTAKEKVKIYGEKYLGLIINQVDMVQYKKYNKDYNYFVEEKSKMKKEKRK